MKKWKLKRIIQSIPINDIRIRIGIVAFLFIEVLSVAVGLWPYLQMNEEEVPPRVTLRLGIIPHRSAKYSSISWDPLIQAVAASTNIDIVPHFTNSYREAVKGFCYGSLDLLLADPYMLQGSREKYGLEPLLMEDLGGRKNQNRSVLICKKENGKQYLSQSHGLRLTFVDEYSYPGFTVPNTYLKSKIPVPLEAWFDKISFAGSHRQAYLNLINGKTDIVAMNYVELLRIGRDDNAADDIIRVLWMSNELPPPILWCRSELNENMKSDITSSLKITSNDSKSQDILFAEVGQDLLALDTQRDN